MKVLYDISNLGFIHSLEGVQGAGIYRATKELGKALARNPNVDLQLCSSPNRRAQALTYLDETGDFLVERFALPRDPLGLQSTDIATNVAARYSDYLNKMYSPERIYNDGCFDIFHLNWRARSTIPAHAYPAVVTSIFDVIAIKNPEWFVEAGKPNEIGSYLSGLISSAGANDVLTVNAYAVKADLLRLFPHLSSAQVQVVPLGVSDRFGPEVDSAALASVKSRYGIPADKRYVLCLNTLEPRKNMKRAIEAFGAVYADPRGRDTCLVLAGSKGWLSEEITEMTRAFGADQSVVMTGFVNDDDIPVLYAGADAFCYPSLDEGFGLPVIEAMASGIPVVTSNRRALREVAGDAAICVDPEDPEAIAGALLDVLSDANLATQMKTQGLARAAEFTWDNAATAMADVYALASEVRRTRTTRPASRTTGQEQLETSLAGLEGSLAAQPALVLAEGADLPPNTNPQRLSTIFAGDRVDSDLGFKPDWLVSSGDFSDDEARQLNGLTGSIIVCEKTSDLLRTGRDIKVIGDPATTMPGAADLPAPTAGPTRLFQMALLLAHHLGNDPVYVMAPATAIDQPATEWFDAYRSAVEASGRTVINLAPGALPEVFETASLPRVLHPHAYKEYPRDAAKSLDETAAIAIMFGDAAPEPRIMVDVGAHRGTSLVFFVDDDWEIFAYEPDPENRRALESRFGSRTNVHIDPRAVGDQIATDLPFFTSEVSGGISGLSSFDPSHRETGMVDMTTLRAVCDDKNITRIDFLKIDVEGFDFSVLKGVPWERVHPAVIECEFEDHKTVPLGHTVHDVADFLVEKGYAVYFSEWHSIIKYGIAHDWRRLVPYPAADLPPDSWGNIVAFADDPGIEAVHNAFHRVIKVHPPHQPVPPAVPSPLPETTPNEGMAVGGILGAGLASDGTPSAPTPPPQPRGKLEALRARIGSEQGLVRAWARRLRQSKKLIAPVVVAGLLLFVLALVVPPKATAFLMSAVVLAVTGLAILLVAKFVRKNSHEVTDLRRDFEVARRDLAAAREDAVAANAAREELANRTNAELASLRDRLNHAETRISELLASSAEADADADADETF